MKNKYYTIASIAKKLGLTNNTIMGRYKKGKMNPFGFIDGWGGEMPIFTKEEAFKDVDDYRRKEFRDKTERERQ